THQVLEGELIIQGSVGTFEVGGSYNPELLITNGWVTNQLGVNGEFRVAGPIRSLAAEGFLNQGKLRMVGGRIDGGSMDGFINNGLMHAQGGILLGDIVNANYFVLQGIIGVGLPMPPLGTGEGGALVSEA